MLINFLNSFLGQSFYFIATALCEWFDNYFTHRCGIIYCYRTMD
jgi:hypothetical protein